VTDPLSAQPRVGSATCTTMSALHCVGCACLDCRIRRMTATRADAVDSGRSICRRLHGYASERLRLARRWIHSRHRYTPPPRSATGAHGTRGVVGSVLQLTVARAGQRQGPSIGVVARKDGSWGAGILVLAKKPVRLGSATCNSGRSNGNCLHQHVDGAEHAISAFRAS